MKPASPLPLLVISDFGQIASGWRGQPPSQFLNASEKREVARRANAYPQIIVALRELDNVYAPYASKLPTLEQIQAAHENARALLRELGEAE